MLLAKGCHFSPFLGGGRILDKFTALHLTSYSVTVSVLHLTFESCGRAVGGSVHTSIAST